MKKHLYFHVLPSWIFRFASALLFLCGPIYSTAQAFIDLGNKGDSAYKAKNYSLAIQYYQRVVQWETPAFLHRSAYYSIACSYALEGDRPHAWKFLRKSVDAGNNDYGSILQDGDLVSLHGDNEWGNIVKLNLAAERALRDPMHAELVTTDIHHFWEAYDMVQKDTAQAAALFAKYYIDKASPGLQDYFITRIFSVDKFVENQRKKRAFYKAIRANTLQTDAFKAPLRKSFERLKELYDSAIFPNVYFVIGRWTSAGTVSGNGLLIGVDMMCKSDSVPLGELDFWEKSVFSKIDNLPYLVAHELIHSQQHALPSDTTTLSACVIEGMADFLGELISGRNANGQLAVYGHGRERQIWSDFQKDMYLNRVSNWMYNGAQATADHPADLGYWVGYQICKSYYDKAADKRQAVYAMLHIGDYREFLVASNYGAAFGAK